MIINNSKVAANVLLTVLNQYCMENDKVKLVAKTSQQSCLRCDENTSYIQLAITNISQCT